VRGDASTTQQLKVQVGTDTDERHFHPLHVGMGMWGFLLCCGEVCGPVQVVLDEC
jgi:hypothetical protein